ncbi:tRNA pseudouridine(13) synthase TruD [Deinococcus sp. KNUC1210]|uniref:tRNA pseudouridine(13) synthase TruD n=1 Tax=Deinococcus sp. KNUC1210 TaxID=2917691 RepID=UPI001EF110C9|nr:tRNA pseudouridine(13) synthase TruD [Deinococcus sp. KNUC1210]ULH16927.1 tRNA pseudouridine(13) synthase TruD [Deinococcus sp. KNUC1210]
MTTFSFTWADLRPLTDTPRTGGVLRSAPEDFRVDEVPLYLPSGEGDHLYLHVRKTGHTTAYLMRELAGQLGLRPTDVAAAGLKDRHAVTTQWLSMPAKAERRLPGFSLDGVEILDVSRHPNRLGMGHLKGNRFTVRVHEAAGTAAQAQVTLDLLNQLGIPNYFGPQRFGLGGLNAEEGLRVLRGESKLRDPAVRRFLVSSVQSLIFNRFLALRLERGLFAALLSGDMAKKHDTGGVFEVQDAALESLRAERGDVSATGTLFGRKVKPLTQDAGALEQEALSAFDLTPAAFSSRKGDRRIIRIFAEDTSVEALPDGYAVSFTLPRGSFATSLLRELTGTDVDGPLAVQTESTETTPEAHDSEFSQEDE